MIHNQCQINLPKLIHSYHILINKCLHNEKIIFQIFLYLIQISPKWGISCDTATYILISINMVNVCIKFTITYNNCPLLKTEYIMLTRKLPSSITLSISLINRFLSSVSKYNKNAQLFSTNCKKYVKSVYTPNITLRKYSLSQHYPQKFLEVFPCTLHLSFHITPECHFHDSQILQMTYSEFT